ncbi:MAG: hypothetical protein WBB45_01990 [Cyclobacteriaceae bacterium]
MSTLLTFCLFTILAIGCQSSAGSSAGDSDQTAIQGISGILLVRKGNFMPSPEENPKDRGTEKPVAGQVYVYKAMSVSDAGTGPYYTSLGDPMLILEANDQGKFEKEMAPGTYSLFIKTEKGLYANSFNGQGLIRPITVEEGKMTEVRLIQDSQAAY